MENSTNSYFGSSKQRRDLLKTETDHLGKEIPFDYGKVSQLRILKAACNYLKKEKHFSTLTSNNKAYLFDRHFVGDEMIRNEGLSGFITCFSKTGELVYVSETTYEHLGLRANDILFTYDNITEMIHDQDKHYFQDFETNFDAYKNGQTFSFYSLWFVSKIKRSERSLAEYKLIKMTGHFDSKIDLFVTTCAQILSVSNREIMTNLSADCFTSVHDTNLHFLEISTSVEYLLGYDIILDNFCSKSLYEILSPECLQLIKGRHLQVLNEKNTKGYLDPVRLIAKNGTNVDCLINIYYDLKDQIVCKYQVISTQNMRDYKEYVFNFKSNWDLYKHQENSTSNSLNIDSFESSSSSSNSSQAEYSNFIAIEETELKRSFEADEELESPCAKRTKIETITQLDNEEYNHDFADYNQELSASQGEIEVYFGESIDLQETNATSKLEEPDDSSYLCEELSYFDGIDLNEILEINSIREDIEKEIYSLENSEKNNKDDKLICNSNSPVYDNFYNSDGYDAGDEHFYQALLEDNDLFQSLQHAF